MQKLHPKLCRYLQLAHAAERAAALAYIGHAASLPEGPVRRHVQQIEDEEWQHREELACIMRLYGIRPHRFLEAKYWLIGKCIGFACHVIGEFMPHYFAGRLESGNVCEYVYMIRHFRAQGITQHDRVLWEMAVTEKEHEQFFEDQIAMAKQLPFFQFFFKWGPGRHKNTFGPETTTNGEINLNACPNTNPL